MTAYGDLGGGECGVCRLAALIASMGEGLHVGPAGLPQEALPRHVALARLCRIPPLRQAPPAIEATPHHHHQQQQQQHPPSSSSIIIIIIIMRFFFVVVAIMIILLLIIINIITVAITVAATAPIMALS